jgi:hypothetical protein
MVFPSRTLRGTEGKVGFEGYGKTANQFGRSPANMRAIMIGGATLGAGIVYYLYQANTADKKDGSAKPVRYLHFLVTMTC